jgi:hypothetical protein
MGDSELLRLVIQPSITVVGWFVAAFWAVKQINLANRKTLELQKTLMSESHKRSLANELIEIYKDVAQSINRLKHKGSMLSINVLLEKDPSLEQLKLSALLLVAPVNEAYEDLCKNVFRLDMWIKVSEAHLPALNKLRDAINHFNEVFSALENRGLPLWAQFQSLLVFYQARTRPVHDEISRSWKDIMAALTKLLQEMTEGTAEVNKFLIKP